MAGFAELYEAHHRRVFSLCLRMMGNVADAEDLTQDIFIALPDKLPSFRGDSAFTTWLHRLTVNTVLMHWRKWSVRSVLLTDDGQLPDRVDPDTLTSAETIINRVALERAIAQLAPGYRTVFLLHDAEGYEHSEIAMMLGFTEGTSKSQRHKARARLRRLLTQGK